MAEAFLNDICGGQFEAHSAGLEPGKLNPIVVEAMQEIGIDISRNQTKAVSDILKSRSSFAYVITFATRAAPNDARSFQVSPLVCTGVFPIHRPSKVATKKSWPALARSATGSRPKWRIGALKSALAFFSSNLADAVPRVRKVQSPPHPFQIFWSV